MKTDLSDSCRNLPKTIQLICVATLLLASARESNDGGAAATAQFYDPSLSTWMARESLTTARSSPAATMLQNAKVLIADGMGSTNLRSAELYDSGTQTNTSLVLDLGAGVTMELVKIPAGTFIMGSPVSEVDHATYGDDETQHQVTISQAFYMGKFDVTQTQFQAITGSNPSYFVGANTPVDFVSWSYAQTFCQQLGTLTGKTVRLPTEAEWEYACRAGTTTPFYTGSTITTDQANFDGRVPYPSDTFDPAGTWLGQPTPVGSFAPNAWGLYDMEGNVWEWCQDWYDVYPSGAVTDPQGPATGLATGPARVLRGGSWGTFASNCRSASRNSRGPEEPNYGGALVGFRVVVQVPTLVATTINASSATATFSTSDQSVMLNASVTSQGGTVNEGTVTFQIQSGASNVGNPVTSTTVSGGNASVSYTIPGNAPAGVFTIQANYSGGSTFAASSDNSATLTISSANHAPVIVSGPTASPAQAFVNQSITFSAMATDRDGDSLTFTWTFGDGSPSANGSTTTHIFSVPGNYPVTLIVNDGNNGQATATIQLQVNSISPPNNDVMPYALILDGSTGQVGDFNYIIKGTLIDKEGAAIKKAKWQVASDYLPTSTVVSKSGKLATPKTKSGTTDSNGQFTYSGIADTNRDYGVVKFVFSTKAGTLPFKRIVTFKRAGNLIYYGFVIQHEGGVFTHGYVPPYNGIVPSYSGVTIGAGFDLGQQSKDSINSLAIDNTLKSQLIPYNGLQTDAALSYLKKHPLSITLDKATQLDDAVFTSYLTAVINAYNGNSAVPFGNLDISARTVIFDIRYNLGGLLGSSDAAVGAALLTQRWSDAISELRKLAIADPRYTARRNDEADLLQAAMDAGQLIDGK